MAAKKKKKVVNDFVADVIGTLLNEPNTFEEFGGVEVDSMAVYNGNTLEINLENGDVIEIKVTHQAAR